MTLTDTPDLWICPLCNARVAVRTCPNDGHTTVRPEELAARRVADPLLGATLDGKYEIERRVGMGSMGSVYKGQNLRTGAPVALKVMHAGLAESGPAVRRFLLEAQNAGRLDNPHVVRVLDRGETAEGLPFLVMEFVDGQTLEALLEAGPVPPTRVVAIAEQIVKGLGDAHRRGLVHRDIKPENVMLVETFGDELHVKLLDFGIARAASTGESPMGTMVLGTPRYMAPEQWSAQAVLDARSDLYSLGCLLYHMVAGRPPFVIETPDERRLVQLFEAAHRTQLPPPLPIPAMAPLSLLIDDLMRKDPAQRPASAEEVLRRLRQMREAPDLPPAPRQVAPHDRATQPDGEHPGIVMPTMVLPIEGETDEFNAPEPTVMLPDEDAPTRALLSPGRLPAPRPSVPPEPAAFGSMELDESEEDGPTVALERPADPDEPPTVARITPAPAPPPPAPAANGAPPPGRRIQNVETLPPPLPTGLGLPVNTQPGDLPREATAARPWLKWVIGTALAVAIGVLLGVVLGGT